ncbi:MAG: argininosuccinate lyase [Epsilonproteobacteria bacterium]|nr:argininosuccinate lyase [Campylobacterota bacterium]
MEKMWSGRFTQDTSTILEKFNASIMFDQKLYREDIEGSIAHAQMLTHQGILNAEELAAIESGMAQVLQEIESGIFEWKIGDEDLHMAIEKRLTAIIGDAGKKLHTARSRNDQVALDFRRFVLRKNREITDQIKALMVVILDIARDHTNTLLPGMTHLQHAQPINFAFHLLAYMSMFKRDCERFESSVERNNISPIGCAALAGTPHNINREMTAKSLGFDSVSINCLDTVSDRSIETAEISLEILREALKTMTVKPQNMARACKMGHLCATDLADYLVEHCGVPFREAHHITGRAVARAEVLGIDLSDIAYEELKAIDDRIKEDVIAFLAIEHSMNARTSQGGTAEVRTLEQILYFDHYLKDIK